MQSTTQSPAATSPLASLWRQLAPPARVSLVVGTVLCLINGTYTAGKPSKIALNYLVPFLVSAYSRYAFQRELKRLQHKGE